MCVAFRGSHRPRWNHLCRPPFVASRARSHWRESRHLLALFCVGGGIPTSPAVLKGRPADLCFGPGSRPATLRSQRWNRVDGVTSRKRGGADACLNDPKLPSAIARRLVSGSTSRCATGCCDMSDAAIFSLNRPKKQNKKKRNWSSCDAWCTAVGGCV